MPPSSRFWDELFSQKCIYIYNIEREASPLTISRQPMSFFPPGSSWYMKKRTFCVLLLRGAMVEHMWRMVKSDRRTARWLIFFVLGRLLNMSTRLRNDMARSPQLNLVSVLFPLLFFSYLLYLYFLSVQANRIDLMNKKDLHRFHSRQHAVWDDHVDEWYE